MFKKLKTAFPAAVLFAFLCANPSGEVIADESIREAIVKVYTVYNEPDYYNPWSMRGPGRRTGSGAVIPGELVLTNAHIVSNATFIQVRRYSDTKRYRAEVRSVLHEADLALLEVKEAGFFEGVTPLEFGELPETHREVAVYGFPLGGDTLSITRGIVSRIEHQRYVHSSAYLLAGQIDAAINPGNSGGPVIMDGKIAGVTMQSIPRAQNIGYMVPVSIVKHFLESIERGRAAGFPSLGIGVQKIENDILHRYYKIPSDRTGVLVAYVVPGSPADGVMQSGDILLALDRYEVANDGTVEFRPKERTWLSYAVQKSMLGEKMNVVILRDGEELSLNVVLDRTAEDNRLVPLEQYDVPPSYYIYGGLVFSPLTKNFLQFFSPPKLTAIFENNIPESEGDEVILITRVLAADINEGYQDMSFPIIEKVNGERVKNMEGLIRLVEENTGHYTVFETAERKIIVFEDEKARASHEQVLEKYRITSDRSENLKHIL